MMCTHDTADLSSRPPLKVLLPAHRAKQAAGHICTTLKLLNGNPQLLGGL